MTLSSDEEIAAFLRGPNPEFPPHDHYEGHDDYGRQCICWEREVTLESRIVNDISRQCNDAARDAVLAFVEEVERRALELCNGEGLYIPTPWNMTTAFREVRAKAVK